GSDHAVTTLARLLVVGVAALLRVVARFEACAEHFLVRRRTTTAREHREAQHAHARPRPTADTSCHRSTLHVATLSERERALKHARMAADLTRAQLATTR